MAALLLAAAAAFVAGRLSVGSEAPLRRPERTEAFPGEDQRDRSAGPCEATSVGLTPLTDLGSDAYRGAEGGLYPGGENERPPSHEEMGRALARAIRPLDPEGRRDPSGKYVLLSLGMSNTRSQFAAFEAMAGADPATNPDLVIVNGAQDGMSAGRWIRPNQGPWEEVDRRLAEAGVTPEQVVSVWVQMATQGGGSWPGYVQGLQEQLAAITALMKDAFPNLRLAYLSSGAYTGYAQTDLNPEPFSYQEGFSVKALIRDQLEGTPGLNHDPDRGPVEAPWLSWGPYLWADGLEGRSDGLTWECEDFAEDGIHPSERGAEKVGAMLLEFFKSDPTASPWFT